MHFVRLSKPRTGAKYSLISHFFADSASPSADYLVKYSPTDSLVGDLTFLDRRGLTENHQGGHNFSVVGTQGGHIRKNDGRRNQPT
jgi:hypothetical protein